MGAQELTLGAGGASVNSGRASEIILAFYDRKGHNFIGRSGMNNFEPTRRIA
jgi:hypothetical protein